MARETKMKSEETAIRIAIKIQPIHLCRDIIFILTAVKPTVEIIIIIIIIIKEL